MPTLTVRVIDGKRGWRKGWRGMYITLELGDQEERTRTTFDFQWDEEFTFESPTAELVVGATKVPWIPGSFIIGGVVDYKHVARNTPTPCQVKFASGFTLNLELTLN